MASHTNHSWKWHMPNGTVKWFNGVAGYGFIQPDDGGGSVFVSKEAVTAAGPNDMQPGQKIEFEIVRLSGKYAAEKLKFITAAVDDK
jgi:cold shock protein